MNYLWTDFETSGLNPTSRKILEVAAVLDVEGKIFEVVDSVIQHPAPIFDPSQGWDSEAWEMHQKSHPTYASQKGRPLLEDMRNSKGIVLERVEHALCCAVAPFPPNSVMLAGNSIHFDRSFIHVHMPKLDGMLHYRHMDVSCLTTFLEGAGVLERDKGPKPHRAMPDVQRSIRTFYTYKHNVRETFLGSSEAPLGRAPDWTVTEWTVDPPTWKEKP